MELFYSPTSPYVRKVAMVAKELGLFSKLTLKSANVLPVQLDNEVAQSGNPLGKIPLLIPNAAGFNEPLFGSQVICQYLDSISSSGHVIPPLSATAPHFHVLKMEALADGMLDALLLARYETALRPEEKRWKDWTDGQMAKALRSLDVLEDHVSKTKSVYVDSREDEDWNEGGKVLDLGSIAVACALGYLDFRFATIDWRERAPRLDKWFEAIKSRRSFVETAPPQ